MHKFLTRVCLLITSLLFVSVSSALTENEMLKSIYKIRTYIENPITGDYVLYSTGSATRITRNRIVTNAHVIMGIDGQPTGKYEICRMIYSGKDPVCFSVGKLLTYDSVADLATLEVADAGPDMAIPKLKTDMLQTGDTLIVYGYPANGGNSITRTEGKMAGRDYEDYKFDGTLDEGSSGGGAFDKNGNFVGVPYAIGGEHGSIGYIIGASTVRKFFDGRTENFEKIPQPIYDQKFRTYMKRIQKLFQASSIKNPYITFQGIDSSGLVLRSAVESFDEKIFDYRFTTKNNRVTMVVMCNKNSFHTNKSDEQLAQEAIERVQNSGSNITLLQTEETMYNFIMSFLVSQTNGADAMFVNIISKEESACNAIISSEDQIRDRKFLNTVINRVKSIRFHDVSSSTEPFFSRYFQVDRIPLDLSITEGTTFDSDLITVRISPSIANLDTEGILTVNRVNSITDFFNYGYDSGNTYNGSDFSYQNFLERYLYYSDDPSVQSKITASNYTSRNGKQFIVSTLNNANQNGTTSNSSATTFFYPFMLGNKYFYYEMIFEYPGVQPEFVTKITELFLNADLPGEFPFMY